MIVSIPSSSGHQFTGKLQNANPDFAEQFQSLLHQGISLLLTSRRATPASSCMFQSLLHQGISLLVAFEDVGTLLRHGRFNPFFIRASVYCSFAKKFIRTLARIVSIPSSSGHQFTDRDDLVDEIGDLLFQSLLHQGISLL